MPFLGIGLVRRGWGFIAQHCGHVSLAGTQRSQTSKVAAYHRVVVSSPLAPNVARVGSSRQGPVRG
jgi:hypothetical protein